MWMHLTTLTWRTGACATTRSSAPAVTDPGPPPASTALTWSLWPARDLTPATRESSPHSSRPKVRWFFSGVMIGAPQGNLMIGAPQGNLMIGGPQGNLMIAGIGEEG